MTLRELRYLIALADRAHFGRAAEDCHISQPTLSTQIRKLEDYLGVSLIERNSKSVSLTPIGEEVVRSARQIVAQADALLASTRVPRGPLEGRLSIGIIPTLGPYFLPSFIPLTKSHYPRLQLVVHEDLTQHLLERLRGYQIDAALLALPLENHDLDYAPLFDEPFWFACPPQHPLATALPPWTGVGRLRSPDRAGGRLGRLPRRESRDDLPVGCGGARLHPPAGAGGTTGAVEVLGHPADAHA
jgi:LysR family hydrogen peroxide-inducible transcriptional activator